MLLTFDQNFVPMRMSSSVVWDLLFQGGCLLVGIQTASVKKLWLDRLVISLWIVLLAFSFYIVPERIYNSILQKAGTSSLCERIFFAHLAIHCTTAFYTAFRVRFDEDVLKPLLRKRGRRCGDVAVFIICTAASLTWNLYAFPAGILSLCVRFWKVLLRFSSMSFFVIYADVVSVVVNEQREILQSLRESSPCVDKLVAKKWEIRDRISTINSMFAGILFSFYLQSFSIAILFIGKLVIYDTALASSVVDLALLLSLLTQLISLARRCSTLYRLYSDTERALLLRARGGGLCNTCHDELFATLRFHGQWDLFKLGCFSHTAENFAKFLATSLTCVTIALQFDYKVLKALATLVNGNA